MLSIAVIVFASAAHGAVPMVPIEAPDPTTRVVLFEDNVLYPDTPQTSLVYRYLGRGIDRQARMGTGAIVLEGGPGSLIHPAQYDRATFQVRLLVGAGTISLAVGHNGMRDVQGRPVERPGVQVVFGDSSTRVVDLATGRVLAHADVVLPRGRLVEVGVAWHVAQGSLRIDLPQGSYAAELPEGLVGPGGVALRTHEDTHARVRRLRVIWEDHRPVVLYDGYHTIYGLAGRLLGQIPPPELPPGAARYATTAIDLARDRSLIAFGGPDFNPILHDTIEGFAVRHLPTGRLLATWGSPLNGCLPLQGGGGFDGLWLLQDWVPPGSLCWVDWDAFDRGDVDGFVQPSHSGRRADATFVGFHDPTNALDGSLARYLRITESWQGVNHLMVHPGLRPFVNCGDVALPQPAGELVSHTGPGGLPGQLAVRDRGRAYYELWAYRGHGLHVQCRGHNLFTQEDDWQGPIHPAQPGAEAYSDWANPVPSLTRPGLVGAPLYRFDPEAEAGGQIRRLSYDWLRPEIGGFVVERRLDGLPGEHSPMQILMDPAALRPAR